MPNMTESRSTKRLLVVQHVPYELLGTLNPLLKREGFRLRYINFGREPDAEPRLDGYDGVVVLGGPMNVDQVDEYPHLEHEIRLIRDALQREMPILGVCLGAQLLAAALGAEVGPSAEVEIGWYPVSPTDEGRRDPLLSCFADTEAIFQWHGDTFQIPQGAVHLATSPGCPNQAFRYGENAYGLQFHMEVDSALIERWLTVPVHVEQLRRLEGKIDPRVIREQTPGNISRLHELSAQAFGAFVELMGHRKRHRVLPSR